MGNVVTAFTMSLDGFIAAPDHDVSRLFKWYFSGDVEFPMAGTDRKFRVAQASVEVMQELYGYYGAVITGRGDFDASRAWGGTSPLAVPVFILTHHPPPEWLNRPSPFTFVTDGVASALAQAQAVAAGKPIAVGGTTVVRQMLAAGLLDEIHIELAPILLGQGIRLFDHLAQPVDLEIIKVIDTPAVTHLRYRVVR